ncbi:uncharacterized protein BP5553_02925 [Venustampulla echinocandica]|uniref:Uncharacterized protein n=1 Tax=Venustampulla echinocandica TaxID=2656787 RepID=A0A370TSS8_9HELO|nr:uncharacterized protein BP5553_02925 [Venustampulla echinocandica]RDL38585.1 hypothetical protein BP5553_02925 [Venustampulla echinocandica]
MLPYLPALDISKSATSPPRPRHQVTRSISELTPTKFHRPHHSHQPHSHHRHFHRHEKGRDHVPESGRSNSQANGLNIGTSSSVGTPNESGDVSRRASVYGARREDGEEEERVVKKGQVKEEKEKGAHRARELRNAILGLNTLSNNTTRRLDNTYYSVLEKLSVLQNTIVAMKELAGMNRRVNEDFKAEGKGMIGDIRVQLNAFEGFTMQDKRIVGLQDRVKKGRAKVEVLGKRVEVVRERVEGWEKAEVEWQEKTRKRLRVLWLIMLVCGVGFIALVVFQYIPAGSQGQGGLKGNASSLAERIPHFEEIGKETFNMQERTENALEGLLNRTGASLEDDPRLRLFDEL